ncbi:hypothetical protein GOP47_0028178, partial [Adiantum capillus-veneris]
MQCVASKTSVATHLIKKQDELEKRKVEGLPVQTQWKDNTSVPSHGKHHTNL